MITDSFDNQSPAKINPPKNENAPSVEATIFTFSNVIEKYVTENYNCEKVGELKIYRLKILSKEKASLWSIQNEMNYEIWKYGNENGKTL